MSDDASLLSELTEYAKESRYRTLKAKDIAIDANGQWRFLVDAEENREPHEATDIALREFSKIVGVPFSYVRRVNMELASYNLNYMASRSEEHVSLTLSDGIISGVSVVGGQFGVTQVLDIIAKAFDKVDPYIIQSELTDKQVSLFALMPDEVHNELGDVHRSVCIVVPLNIRETPMAVPGFSTLIDETSVMFPDVMSKDVTNGKEPYDDDVTPEKAAEALDGVIRNAIRHLDDIDSVIAEGQQKILKDMRHFSYIESDHENVSSPTQKKLFQILSDLDISNYELNAIDVAKGVMETEEMVKPQKQVIRLSMLAGRAFYVDDPHYCPSCHRELDEDGAHIPDAEKDGK